MFSNGVKCPIRVHPRPFPFDRVLFFVCFVYFVDTSVLTTAIIESISSLLSAPLWFHPVSSGKNLTAELAATRRERQEKQREAVRKSQFALWRDPPKCL